MSAPLQFEAQVNAAELNKLLSELTTGGQEAARALNSALGGTVTKKLVLETITDESGVKRLVAAEKERLSVTDQIVKAQAQLAKIDTGSATALRGQLREATQVRDQIRKISVEVDRYGNVLRATNPDWAEANARVRQLSRELQVAGSSNFWQELKARTGLGGLLAVGNGLNQIVQTLQSATILVGQFTGAINNLTRAAAEVQSISLSFAAIDQGATGGVVALQESSRIALGLGASLDNVQTGFQQLSPVILQTGGTMKDVSDITEALASRFVAFGIAGDRARRIMMGVIQAFAKGKLQAEELTQQISEADPAFKTDFARAIGVSTAELEKLVQAGEITVDVLRETLPALGKSALLFGKLGSSAIDAVSELEKGEVTIDQVRGNLQNLDKLSLRRLALVGEPLINSLLRAQAVATDLFDGLSRSGVASGLVEVFGSVTKAAINLVQAFSTIVQGLATVLSPIIQFIGFLSKFPGVAELAGLALLTKLFNPLQKIGAGYALLQGKIGNFWKRISSPSDNPTAAIDAASGAVKRLGGSIDGISETGFGGRITQQFGQIAAASRAANSEVVSSTTATLSRVTKEYSDTYSKLIALEAKRGQAADALQSSEFKKLGSGSEAFIRTQQGVADAVSEAGSAGKVAAGDLAGLDSSFGRAGAAAAKAEQQLARFATLSAELPNQTGKGLVDTSMKLQRLGNEIGNIGVKFDKSLGRMNVDPGFLKSLDAISAVDPSRGLLLTGTVLENLKRSYSEFESAINSGRISLGPQEANKSLQGLGNTIRLVEGMAGKLSERVATLGQGSQGTVDRAVSGRIKASIADYNSAISELRDSIDQAIKGPGEVLRNFDATAAAAEVDQLSTNLSNLGREVDELSGRSISLDDTGIVGSQALIDETINKLAEQEAAQKVASDSTIGSLRKEIAQRKETLGALERQRKAIEDLGEAGGQAGGTASRELVKRIEGESAALAKQETALDSLQASHLDTARSSLNLADSWKTLNSTSASYEKRVEAAGNLTKLLGEENSRLAQSFSDIQVQQSQLLTARLETQGRIDAGGLDPDAYARATLEVEGYNSALEGLAQQQAVVGQQQAVVLDGLNRVSGVLDGTTPAVQNLASGFTLGQRASNLFSKGLSGLGSITRSAGDAIKNLWSQLGPLELGLIAVGVATKAYSDANRESARIATESKQRIDALNDSISAFKQPEAKPETGLAGLWQDVGNVIKGVFDSISDGFAGVGKATEGSSNAVLGFANNIAVFAAVTGGAIVAALGLAKAVTAIGVALGLTIAVTAPWIALIAGLIAGVAALSLVQDGAQRANKKNIQSIKDQNDAYEEENIKVKELTDGYLELARAKALAAGEEPADPDRAERAPGELNLDSVTRTQGNAIFNEALVSYELRLKGVEAAEANVDRLRKSVLGLSKELQDVAFAPDDQSRRAAERSLSGDVPLSALQAAKAYREANTELERARAAAEIAKQALDGVGEAIGRGGAEAGVAAVTVGSLSEELRAAGEALNLYGEEDVGGINWSNEASNVARLTVQLDRLKTANEQAVNFRIAERMAEGFASGALPVSIRNVSTQLKALGDIRPTLDINDERLPGVIANIVRIEDDLKQLQAQDTIIEIEQRLKALDAGEISNSISQLQGIKSSLESVIISLDIDSPKLPEIIEQMIEVDQRIDEVDGRRAQITIELLEKGRQEGTILETLSSIGREISALETLKATIPIDSSGIDEVIGKIDTLRLKQEQGARSSEQLRASLAEFYWNKEIQSIQSAERADQQRHDKRIQQLNDQLKRIQDQAEASRKASDATVRALQASIPDPSNGPAAKALAAYQKQQLQKQARSSDKGERLQAQAQLEALEYAERREKVEKRIKAEQEAQRVRDEQAAEKQKQIQEQIAKVEEKRRAEAEKRQEQIFQLQQNIAEQTALTAELWVIVAEEILRARDAMREYNSEAGGGGGTPSGGSEAQSSPSSGSTGSSEASPSSFSPEAQSRIDAIKQRLAQLRGEFRGTGTDSRAATGSVRGFTNALLQINGVSAPSDGAGGFFPTPASLDNFVSQAAAAGASGGQQAGQGLVSGVEERVRAGYSVMSQLGMEMSREVGQGFSAGLALVAQSEFGPQVMQGGTFVESYRAQVSNYRSAVGELAVAQQQQAGIQQALNQAIASGASSGLIGALTGQLNSAKAATISFQENVDNMRGSLEQLALVEINLDEDGFGTLEPILEDLSTLNTSFTSAGQSAVDFASSLREASDVEIGSELDEAATQASALATQAAEAGTQLGDASTQAGDLDASLGDTQSSIEGAATAAEGVATQAAAAAEQALGLAENSETAGTKLSDATSYSENLSGELSNAAEEAKRIDDNIKSLDGTTITIRVNVVPSRWTGGDVMGGKSYQVNELGQEGFLSASGAMRPIRAPRNALWKAPGTGTVIPAHIWRDINAPTARVSPTALPAAPGRAIDPTQRLQRALVNALRPQPHSSDPALRDLATVQAEQALQIGNLSRAVGDLTKKDWNMQVNVRSSRTGALLDAINRRL